MVVQISAYPLRQRFRLLAGSPLPSRPQAAQAVARDEIQLVSQQMSNNINPAETIYNLAKRRGYSSEPAKASDQTAKSGMDKLNRMERGVKASRSMNGKGVSPNNRLTLEEIAELPDDEFDNFDWAKVLQLG